MSKYYIEYGALQANGKRLIECETSALEAKKITEDFAREIADALNGREALKQEKAEIEANALAVGGIVEAARHKPSGNAAAMREALIAMVDAETEGSMERDDLCGRCLEKMWNSCKHDGSCWVDKVINALSAPARNCDLYDNKTDAETRFVEETGENDMAQHYWQMFAIWLFAPSAERKGECNGK